jgi:hypothetical protein
VRARNGAAADDTEMITAKVAKSAKGRLRQIRTQKPETRMQNGRNRTLDTANWELETRALVLDYYLADAHG